MEDLAYEEYDEEQSDQAKFDSLMDIRLLIKFATKHMGVFTVIHLI
jgi:hypothetical protein